MKVKISHHELMNRYFKNRNSDDSAFMMSCRDELPEDLEKLLRWAAQVYEHEDIDDVISAMEGIHRLRKYIRFYDKIFDECSLIIEVEEEEDHGSESFHFDLMDAHGDWRHR